MIRNQLRLPHPLRTDLRICVICKPDSKAAASARAGGAVLIGEENVFETIRQKQIDFDRCLCHQDSVEALAKSGIARILGPKKLMPSAKMGTVVKDVRAALRGMVGSTIYREKDGVVRVAVGQLGYGPHEMQQNVQAVMQRLKQDAASLKSKNKKELYEVVGLPSLSIYWRYATAIGDSDDIFRFLVRPILPDSLLMVLLAVLNPFRWQTSQPENVTVLRRQLVQWLLW